LAWLCSSYTAHAQSEPQLLEDAGRYTGQIIYKIRFEPEQQPLSQPELRRILPVHEGGRFDVQALRESIRKLFATGRFADIRVDATEEEHGLVVRFTTKPAYFVGHVAIVGGKPPPNSGQLFAATHLNLGTRYFDGDRGTARNAILEILRQNGFYNAQINSSVEYDAAAQEANITFGIQPRSRARFEAPEITGHPDRPYKKIVNATGWKRFHGLHGWQYATAARLQQGLGNVRRYYERRDLLRAQVRLTNLRFIPETDTVQPSIDIEAGPKILIQVSGVHVSRGKLKELVPIYQERSIDADLLTEGERNLQRYFQSIGYFGARVSYDEKSASDNGAETIQYQVVHGPSHRLVAVLIHGNRYFSTQLIRERLLTTPAEFPRYPRGRFSDDNLRADVQSIETLYQSNGFQNVKISYKVIDDYLGARSQIAVDITINEGPQTLVSGLTISGIALPDELAVRQMLASGVGQAFSQVNVAYDRDTILRYFYDQGFLDAAFEFSVTHGSDLAHVRLAYVVTPGERSYVRNIFVTGLHTTRPSLVLDRISLKRGEPLSLSKQTDTQRRLSDLGIFAKVDSALQNPDGSEDSKSVLYDITEARHYALTVGVGAQIARIGGGVTTLDNPAGTTGFAPRVAIGITRENFLGLGQTLGLQTAVSTIRQRAALTYFIPQFVSNDKLSLTTTALIDESNDIRTFSSSRKEVSMQLGERLSRQYTLQYRFVFRHVTESNLKINPLLVPLLSQPETVGLTEVSLIQDRRDDPTDAHRGVYTTLDLGYAPAFFGSQTQFARGLVRNSTYHQITRNLVFARSTQFGLITRTGGHPTIPLPERLYSGGSTSLRAFPDFQAGPRDLVTGFPLGGNALFINNLEMRFPVYGENLGGVIFHDAGNVFSSPGDMSFRFRQSNLQDFNYLVHDFGLGIRYRTPIGPLRVDLSFSPDAPRFFGLKGTLQDYINGTGISTVQKINAFQFHISLGQAF
jgi:outer membrane protein assembly complex protein YaeT